MSIEIKRYRSEDKNVWNDFVQRSVNGNFLFDRNYMDYHQHRFTDHSILIFWKEKLSAIIVANEQDTTIQSHGGLTYGGMLFTESLRLEEVLKFFYHGVKYFHENGFHEIVYKCIPAFLTKAPSHQDQYALFRLEAELFRRDAGSVVPSQFPIRYQERKKRSVKKAQAGGFKISTETTPDIFWSTILSPNLKERYNLNPVHSVDEIKLLMERFPQRVRFYGVERDELVAGTIIFDFDHTAHAQYIAANTVGKENGALDLLFFHLIENVYKSKQYFSFGVSTEKNATFLNRGLQEWKEGFSSRTMLYDFYRINTSNYQLLAEYA